MRVLAAALAAVLLAACNVNLGTAPSGPTPSPVPSGQTFLYVADSGNDSVFVFPRKATGSELPLRTIAGGGTLLVNPSPIAADPSGNIWVASHGSLPALLEFSAYASGNTTPLAIMYVEGRTIATPLSVTGVTFDVTGRCYVAAGPANHVLVFSSASAGVPTPLRDITGPNTKLSNPQGIAFDPAGDIYVASSGSNAILEFGPGADGDAAPIRTITGFIHTRLNSPSYVAVDSSGNIFALNAGGTITEYSASASGDAVPIETFTRAGAGTQMVFDAAGNLYVGSLSGAPVVYAPPITGTNAPIQILSSPVFSQPTGVYPF